MVKFLRRNTDRYSMLGRKRRKKRIWRKPKGRHNKMREKRRGYSVLVEIGYKKEKNANKKKIIRIRNTKDIANMKKGDIGFIESIGKRKKIEIAKEARIKGIFIQNLNLEKFLKKNEIKKQENKK